MDQDNIHITTNKRAAAFLSTLDCPFKIEVRSECCTQGEALLLEDVRAIEVSEGVFDLELSQEQARRLAHFLAYDEWRGQDDQ